MRVIGGRLKGRRLSGFTGLSIRPTSDKVREAVFNILPHGFGFRKVLDLFAGTGAMGIEALSRGAGIALFIDREQKSINTIKKNVEACGVEARVFKQDVLKAVRSLSERGEGFDLIFIDPPYDTALFEAALVAIDSGEILEKDGVIVAETSRRAPLSVELKNLEVFDERKYGDTLVYFLRRRG